MLGERAYHEQLRHTDVETVPLISSTKTKRAHEAVDAERRRCGRPRRGAVRVTVTPALDALGEAKLSMRGAAGGRSSQIVLGQIADGVEAIVPQPRLQTSGRDRVVVQCMSSTRPIASARRSAKVTCCRGKVAAAGGG